MALFSKPPAKKPDPKPESGSASGPRAVSAREVAAQAAGRHKAPPPRGPAEPAAVISVTGASLLDWSPKTPSSIEVAQATAGLCAVLENAALLYASGQAAQARSLLEHGVATDEDTKLSPLAWLALFDVMQRANDRHAFDQLALQYVVQFERSPPAWEERDAPAAQAARPTAAGYVALTGTISAGVASPLEGLRRIIDKRVPQARVDFSQVTGYDESGARALAELLAQARRQHVELTLQRPEKLRGALEAAVAEGKAGGEAAWLLALELMQWQLEQDVFDERAVDFAVTFERSPPSWEPPATPAEAPAAAAPEAAVRDGQQVAWSGVLAGSGVRQLAELNDLAQRRNVVAIDMAAVERIDFVCAGSLLNTINRVEGQRKSVQITGASPIIRALLLLIGISPRHFVRKSS
jgi:anti-anti-sigma regulatory factor